MPFPESRCTGYDVHGPTVDVDASATAVAERVAMPPKWDACGWLPAQCDLVAALDMLHNVSNPLHLVRRGPDDPCLVAGRAVVEEFARRVRRRQPERGVHEAEIVLAPRACADMTITSAGDRRSFFRNSAVQNRMQTG